MIRAVGLALIVVLATEHRANSESPTRPPITAVIVDAMSHFVIAGSQAGLSVSSWPVLSPVRSLPTELANIHDLAFSPDGKMLAAVGGDPGQAGGIELYHWPSGELWRRFAKHDDVVCAVAWQSEAAVFATASADKRVCIHDAKTCQTLETLEGHSRSVMAVDFLPGVHGLVSAGVDESLRLWDLKPHPTGQREPLRTLTNHTRQVYDLAARPSPDSELPVIASIGEDGTVRLWQPTIGRLMRFVRLKSVPMAVVWTLDGRLLATACRDGMVRVIDPDSVEVVQEIPAIEGPAYSIAFTNDNSLAIGGENGQLKRVVLNSSQ